MKLYNYICYDLLINLNHLLVLIFVCVISFTICCIIYINYDNITFYNFVGFTIALFPTCIVIPLVLTEFENNNRLKNLYLIPVLNIGLFTYSFFYTHYYKYKNYKILEKEYISILEKWITDDEFLIKKLLGKEYELSLNITGDYEKLFDDITIYHYTADKVTFNLCNKINELLKETDYKFCFRNYEDNLYITCTKIVIYHKNDLKYIGKNI